MYMFIFKKFVISGDSMVPVLKSGDTVIASPLPYLLRKPTVGDIVICKDPRTDRILIKRIFAFNNSLYSIRGDNQDKSTDSRKFGMIHRKDILGKVLLKL